MIIDQLPLLGGDVQGTDEFPIERGTTTYKTTQAALIKPATDAAAAAQAAADDAQDTADEANEKGLPPGGTAGQVLTKADSSDYSASWEDPSGGGDVTADMLGIVINGNSTPVGASVGQYVIVKNSTISGITDGLYTATQAIPANTAIDATYLTAVSVGGLNAVARDAQWKLVWTNPNPTNSFPEQTFHIDLSGYSWLKIMFRRDTATDANAGFAEMPIDGSTPIIFSSLADGHAHLGRRIISYASQSEILIRECTIYNNYAGGGTTNNSLFIPYKFYAR